MLHFNCQTIHLVTIRFDELHKTSVCIGHYVFNELNEFIRTDLQTCATNFNDVHAYFICNVTTLPINQCLLDTNCTVL